jgi:hypothetical protein
MTGLEAIAKVVKQILPLSLVLFAPFSGNLTRLFKGKPELHCFARAICDIEVCNIGHALNTILTFHN